MKRFIEEVFDGVVNILGPGYDVKREVMIRNNNISFECITIREEDSKIAPTVYLDEYFRQYRSGRNICDICSDIVNQYYMHKDDICIKTDEYEKYEIAKDNIYIKLINYEKNEDMLKNTPHIRYLDLAIICYSLFCSENGYVGTAVIKETNLSYWNIDRDELIKNAILNTMDKQKPKISRMIHILTEMLEENKEMTDEMRTALKSEEKLPMYVLTNEQKMFGATCMVYSKCIKEFADEMKSDLYILPSSIHEVIIIPADDTINRESLDNMVKEINDNELNPLEILSDHSYYYNREEDIIY